MKFSALCAHTLIFFSAALTTVAAALPSTLKVEAQNRDSYNWDARHAAILERNKTVKPDYVFFGDSITHWWGGEPVTKFKAVCPDSWKSLFYPHSVTNMGFGFDYIDNAYYRAENGELDGISPRVILVNIGTNNIGHRRDSAKACGDNMKAFVTLLRKKKPKAKILLIGIYPRREAPLADTIEKANKLFEKLADGRNVFFVNPGKLLLGPDGKRADPKYMRDTVHLNPAGYRVIGAELEKALEKIDPKYD